MKFKCDTLRAVLTMSDKTNRQYFFSIIDGILPVSLNRYLTSYYERLLKALKEYIFFIS